MHSEEFKNFYHLINIIRVIEGMKIGMRNVNKMLIRKPDKCRHKWDDNTTTDRKEIGCAYVDWIHLAHDINQWWILVKMLMKFSDP
jgi:hypothetical protein